MHSYTLVEAAELIQRRLGVQPALSFLAQSQAFHIHWIDEEDHAQAVDLLRARNRPGLSLVDCASFVIMHRYRVTTALAFEGDFEAEGFVLASI